jgi:hypothetical protein
MLMKKIIISSAMFLAAVFPVAAQDLDPTVEVSRRYEGKLIDVHKPDMEMAVPDSVYMFDLYFDYSVFDNPYKGSYDFNPYTMDMKPESHPVYSPVFYLNAGAGYTLHPLLDVLYSPVQKGAFNVDIYGSHRSYIGDYRNVHVGENAAGGYFESGYDLLSKAGADMGYDWENISLDFGASYYGLAVKDAFKKDDYNSVKAYLDLKSKSVDKFMYGVGVSYRYGNEGLMNEHLFDVTANVSHAFRYNSRIEVGFGVDFGVYAGGADVVFGNFHVLPRYIYENGRFRSSVGARVSAVTSQSEGFSKANQFIYPDVRLSYDVIKDAMRLYLNVRGGETLNTYHSIIDGNHHASLSYALPGKNLLGSSVERIHPEIGFEGRISSFFSYGVKGGYLLSDNALMNVLVRNGAGYRPALGYSGYQQGYAQAQFALGFESFRCDGAFTYAHSWDSDQLAEGSYVVLPPEFKAQLSVVYNWNRRLYVGADCDFASRSKTAQKDVYLPHYIDLGAYVEYAVNKNISVWLRGGNLLDMEIQKSPLFAEKGLNFTAGICLNF